MRRFLFASLGIALCLASVEASAQEISARSANIRLGGRLHSQYAASSVDGAQEQFFFRRVRLTVDVSVTELFTARIQPDFAGGKARLQDAYVALNFSEGFSLSMGQFKRAFDIFELASSTDLSLIERGGRVPGVDECTGVRGGCSYSGLTERLLFAGRDQGLRLDLSGGRLAFQGTMTNGLGINLLDENGAKSFSGRVTFDAGSGVSISGQYAVHDYVDEADESAYAGAWGADVQVGGWRDGLLFQAAVVAGDNWRAIDAGGKEAPFTAVQGVASYYVPLDHPRYTGLEPLLRVGYADPDGDAADDGAVTYTPGLMLYIQGKNKIGFNVDVYSRQTGGSDYSFKMQAFLHF